MAVLVVALSLVLSGGASAASDTTSCGALGERNVTIYSDTSYSFPWNYIASKIANSLTQDVNTDKILDDKTFDMRTDLISLATRYQKRLNNAWYLLTTLVVVILLLLPVMVVTRTQTEMSCAFMRKWLSLSKRRDIVTPYTICTAVFAALITMFYTLQICAFMGVEDGVDIMQAKTWEIRKDMRSFLNSMNCRFDRFLDSDIKPTLENLKDTFSSGMISTFSEQLGQEVQNVITNTRLKAVYDADFVNMLGPTIAAYANKEEASQSLNNLLDSASKADIQIGKLWKELISEFDSLKIDSRQEAIKQVVKVESVAEKVENSVHRKITEAKNVLITHELTYPGFLGRKTDPFRVGRNRLRVITFVTSLIVVVFVLALLVTIAIGVSMRNPDSMPVERTKFSNFAGLAIMFTAYGALPASAVLLVIGRNIMNLSVAAQAFICNPYSRRDPSLVDHIRFAAEINRKYTAHILDYLTYPSNFKKCASTLENGIRKDIEPLETVEMGLIRKELLNGPPPAVHRHSDVDLKALLQYVLDFKAFVDEERLRINIESEAGIQKLIGDIVTTLSNGSEALATRMSDAVEKSYRNVVRRKVHRLEAALSGVKTNVIAALGHCDELKQAYDSGVSIMCNVILSNTNGFWAALVAISVLVTCASFTSMRLSKNCLKMTRQEFNTPDDDDPVPLSVKQSCNDIAGGHVQLHQPGQDGDFGSTPTPGDDPDVTVVRGVHSTRYYDGSGEMVSDSAFRA